ncbi:MAG TPA: hypothetical protein VL463_08390 [Kofleriaceae bacterium]|jgi:hypothetical protein|nr:hypothetical protein [Kofleriaceae bacterium]
MRLAWLAAVVLLALPSIARADDAVIATDTPKTPHRIEARIGMLIGGGDVGDVTGASSGLHVAIGGRYGEVTGMAEYDYLSVGDGDSGDRRGDLSRGGLTARMSLFHTDDDGPIAGDYWAEAGVGYEHVSWAPGGVLDRPDLVLGFGAELDGHAYWQSAHPRHIGMWLGFRAILARAPRTDSPAVCGGPCTMATPPSRNDVGLYFSWGMHWGR